ncbi:AN1-type zinc finger protein 1-like [Tubulanus polymorphus]|uniref:AN1-type zinc finger protein 1-like n=1 Tax=Tubulanus polymorphus TaxID=672921 RepID=UPI003DA3C178
MAEMNIGSHCAFESCKQIDFLPFKCSWCSQLFCKVHRTVENHLCSEYVENKADIQPFEGTKSYPCASAGCEKRELTQIICEHCRNNFCLSHRHAQDHRCASITKESENSYKHTAKATSIGSRPLPSKGFGRKSKKTLAKVALMKVKQKATGDKGIPETERLYFDVQFLDNSMIAQNKPLYISKKWSVGKIIDYIASTTGLKNENNTSSDKKLRLFNGETGHILETEASIETLISDDFYSGCAVIVDYVQPTVTRLENIENYLRK